jgi:hypothetical protein
MVSANQIRPEMPVVCSKNSQFAIIDHMEGLRTIKLKKDDTGRHHYIPLRWVISTEDGKVKIDRPGDEAMREWSLTPPAI